MNALSLVMVIIFLAVSQVFGGVTNLGYSPQPSEAHWRSVEEIVVTDNSGDLTDSFKNFRKIVHSVLESRWSALGLTLVSEDWLAAPMAAFKDESGQSCSHLLSGADHDVIVPLSDSSVLNLDDYVRMARNRILRGLSTGRASAAYRSLRNLYHFKRMQGLVLKPSLTKLTDSTGNLVQYEFVQYRIGNATNWGQWNQLSADDRLKLYRVTTQLTFVSENGVGSDRLWQVSIEIDSLKAGQTINPQGMPESSWELGVKLVTP